MKYTHKGFSLLELLLVVGLGIILTTGALAIYNKMSYNMKIDETIDFLHKIEYDIQQLYLGRPNFGTVGEGIEAELFANNLIPAKYGSGPHIRMPFGDQVDTDIFAGTDNFLIRVARIERDVCIRFFTIFSEHPNLIRMVYNRTWSRDGTGGTDVTANMTPQNANTLCIDRGNSIPGNSLEFYFM
jgi:type II secretory pathway pseudopilin PulG